MDNRIPPNREFLLDEIKLLLPNPLREETQLDGSVVIVDGDPGEVIVRMTGSKLSVAEFSACWEGPHTLVVQPRQVATLNWRRLPAPETTRLLQMLIEAIRSTRRSKYRICERCGETKPPEWMHGESICQSCAELHLGIVH